MHIVADQSKENESVQEIMHEYSGADSTSKCSLRTLFF